MSPVKYLIQVDENYFIVPTIEDGDEVIAESEDEAVLEAARKIARKTGAKGFRLLG